MASLGREAEKVKLSFNHPSHYARKGDGEEKHEGISEFRVTVLEEGRLRTPGAPGELRKNMQDGHNVHLASQLLWMDRPPQTSTTTQLWARASAGPDWAGLRAPGLVRVQSACFLLFEKQQAVHVHLITKAEAKEGKSAAKGFQAVVPSSADIPSAEAVRAEGRVLFSQGKVLQSQGSANIPSAKAVRAEGRVLFPQCSASQSGGKVHGYGGGWHGNSNRV